MEGIPTHEADHGLDPEPRPFSVVLAPTAIVAVHTQRGPGLCGGVFIRHLCAQKSQQGRDRDSKGSKHPLSRLSSTILVVRAQSHALHLFRGRKLCRVVEFPSAVVDVAGLPWGSSPSATASSDTLCVAVCRDGTAYALPTTEILEAAERGGDATNRSGKSGHKFKPAGSGDGSGSGSGGGDAGIAPSGASERKRSSRSFSSSAAVGIFDDLAPTILDEPQETSSQELAASQQHKDSSITTDGRGGVVLGGLVIQAQKRWASFIHLGARTVVACSDQETAAVAGIIDRAALYGFVAEKRNDDGGSETPTAGERHLGTLVSADGAAPTTSCTVWIEDRNSDSSALGDGKGFPLPSTVFHLLFGAELSPRPVHSSSKPAAAEGDAAHLEPPTPKTSVVLIGDAAGTVRWSPVPPHPGISGGVLATLPGEATAIVATLPQLDAESRAVGVLLVGANGAVLSLAATTGSAESSRCRAPRKRPRPEDAEESGGSRDVRGSGARGGERGSRGESTTTTMLHGSAAAAEAPAPAPVPSVSRCLLGLPFPVASACSAPGFLLHCYAGALFATALQVAGGGQEDTGGPPTERFDRFERPDPNRVPTPALSLRPVRLPLPCDTVGMAVAPVLISEDETTDTTTTSNDSSAASAIPAVLRTLVVSLSARGRLVGFMAPQSVEELEGWSLHTGRGGVRVGGNAGVERRLRWQLERLSNLRGQCAALADESAERDREIRTLRGAAVLLPPLVAAATHRQRNRPSSGGGASVSPASLAHSISMIPDTQDAAAGCADSYGGGLGAEQHDALQVRLCVRLWPREGGRVRGELQAVGGEDGAGRWFIVTRVVAEDGGCGSGGGGGGDGFNTNDVANATEEGWAWSTSAVVPMGSLRQGWPWSSSVALTLPSARPIIVCSWLQFRFGADGGDSNTLLGGGAEGPLGKAAGVCVELGSSRFDVLDWGVKLSSVPRGAAAVRAASRGRGSSFCGPELAIADVLDASSSPAGGGGRSGSSVGRGLLQQANSAAAERPPVPAAWSSFRFQVVSPDRGPGALLSLLVPSSTSPSPAPDSNSGGGRSGGGRLAETAIRVAGQVAIVRAIDCTATAGAAAAAAAAAAVVMVVPGGPGERGGQGRARPAAGSRVVELAVTCSHAAMTPLVREALLSRARVLQAVPAKEGRAPASGGSGGSGSGGGANGEKAEGGSSSGGVVARGDATARLAREVHSIKQAVADAGDAARALGAARASDGPSAESSKKALALMYKVGEIYQSLRRQQERVGST